MHIGWIWKAGNRHLPKTVYNERDFRDMIGIDTAHVRKITSNLSANDQLADQKDNYPLQRS